MFQCFLNLFCFESLQEKKLFPPSFMLSSFRHCIRFGVFCDNWVLSMTCNTLAKKKLKKVISLVFRQESEAKWITHSFGFFSGLPIVVKNELSCSQLMRLKFFKFRPIKFLLGGLPSTFFQRNEHSATFGTSERYLKHNGHFFALISFQRCFIVGWKPFFS